MDWFDLVQWPAFAASLAAAYLMGSKDKRRRNMGFRVFLLSNVMWVVWGVHTQAWALIALQVGLAALNLRGLFKTEDAVVSELADLFARDFPVWQMVARRAVVFW